MEILVLQEGSRPQELGYHFTDIEGFLKIVNSNGCSGLMKATNSPVGIADRIIYVPDKSGDYVKIKSTSRYDEYRKINLGENPPEDLRYKKLSGNHLKALSKKPSWSYTRRKQGMSYRNFYTFDEGTVCIVIDIDKISERQKIVPFTWNSKSHQKSGANFEFEERVIGDTKNFNKFIKKVYFKQELRLDGFKEEGWEQEDDEEEEYNDNQFSEYSIAYLDSLEEFVQAKEIEKFCLNVMKYNPQFYQSGNFYSIFKYSKNGDSILKEFDIKSILYDDEGNTSKSLITKVQDKINQIKSMFNYINKLDLSNLSTISEKDIEIDEGINALRKAKIELIFLDKSRKSPIDFNKALQNYINDYNKEVSRINSTFKKFKNFVESDRVYQFLRDQLNLAPSLIAQAKQDLESLKKSVSKNSYENFMKDYSVKLNKVLVDSGLKGIKTINIESKYGNLVFILNKSKKLKSSVYGSFFIKKDFDNFMDSQTGRTIDINDNSIKLDDFINCVTNRIEDCLNNSEKREDFSIKFSVYDMNADYDEELTRCEIGINFDYDSDLDSYIPRVKSSVYRTHG